MDQMEEMGSGRDSRVFLVYHCLEISLIAQLVKNPPAMQETLLDSWIGKICWRKDRLPTPVFLGFPCGSAGKESACNAWDLDSIPGLGRYPEEGKGNPLCILAWKIPWTEEPGGLQSMGSQRVGHDWVGAHITRWIIYLFIHFLPFLNGGQFQGCSSMSFYIGTHIPL